MQIALTIIFFAWLFAVLYLLYRHAIGAGARARQVSILLADATLKSAEAAHEAAEAAHEAAEAAHKLADILEQKHVE